MYLFVLFVTRLQGLTIELEDTLVLEVLHDILLGEEVVECHNHLGFWCHLLYVRILFIHTVNLRDGYFAHFPNHFFVVQQLLQATILISLEESRYSIEVPTELIAKLLCRLFVPFYLGIFGQELNFKTVSIGIFHLNSGRVGYLNVLIPSTHRQCYIDSVYVFINGFVTFLEVDLDECLRIQYRYGK